MRECSRLWSLPLGDGRGYKKQTTGDVGYPSICSSGFILRHPRISVGLPSLVIAKIGKSFATSKHLFTFVTVFRCQITVFRCLKTHTRTLHVFGYPESLCKVRVAGNSLHPLTLKTTQYGKQERSYFSTYHQGKRRMPSAQSKNPSGGEC